MRVLHRLLVGIGGKILASFETMYDFCALTVGALLAMIRPPWQIAVIFEQFYHLIVRSAPLVLITALSTGAVLALQFGHGMERFGGKYYVPTVVGLSIVRALGPVFTCLMIASRVGSGIAAELGGMAASQQVDALRALGSDPIKKLVAPRVIALFIGGPMLTLLADLAGVFGGLLVGTYELGIAGNLYMQKTYDAIRMTDVLVGLGKTAFFAVFIGLIGCFNGLATRAGTAGIGAATTRAVVVGSIFVMLGDVFVTKLTWMVGL